MCCIRSFLSLLLTGLLGAQAASQTSDAQSTPPKDGPPRVFLLDAKALAAAREDVRNSDPAMLTLLESLKADAREALAAGPFSVVFKEAVPPSGDRHDYMSQGPYWWPNPATPDGLPYIRRDGERNPELKKLPDRQNLREMIAATETLALAYHMTGDEAFGKKTAELLRVWFLDPATRMNPHLRFGQGIPGINTGRGIGIIETSSLVKVVDAAGLIETSASWSDADHRGLQQWFDAYLAWLLESPYGRDEAGERNNHGTYYDLQAATFALFAGKPGIAADILRQAGPRRVAVQIDPDGSQPLELARTRSWSYSTMNLRGFMLLARLGEHTGVDLWNYETADGRSIRKALDFLTPFALGEKKWPHRQITEWNAAALAPMIQEAARKFPEAGYAAILGRMEGVSASDWGRLIAPQTPERRVQTIYAPGAAAEE